MQRDKLRVNNVPAEDVQTGAIALAQYVVRDSVTGKFVGANPSPITQAQALTLVSYRG